MALSEIAESRKTTRPRPCCHLVGNRKCLQKVIKKIAMLVVIVVALHICGLSHRTHVRTRIQKETIPEERSARIAPLYQTCR